MSARPPKPVYFSNGQALQSAPIAPPLTVRLTRFIESIYFFLGLYFTTLFSLDSYAAAENSSFNINNQKNRYTTRSRWGGAQPHSVEEAEAEVEVAVVRDLVRDALAVWMMFVGRSALHQPPSMSEIPATNAEWADKIANMKKQLPRRSLTQPPIPTQIHRTIDHTLLTTPVDASQIDTLCKEALEYDFAGVCVRLEHVARAAGHLKGSNTAVACVVGFPEGTHETTEKVREAKEAVQQGATELDMVIRYNLLKEGRYKEVFDDVLAVRHAAPTPIVLKAILEATELEEHQLIDATIVSCMAGADYIKTSTGWNGGASAQHLKLMNFAAQMCGCTCLIKASGGIRNAEELLRMLKAGANRIGTSSGVKIMKEIDEGEVLEQGCGHAVA
ncbi:hypothetical protein N7497_008330 [Penicillium chrysogenum]|nr:hypothetical protein N7497_008330 [Penicillium chrysogenum]